MKCPNTGLTPRLFVTAALALALLALHGLSGTGLSAPQSSILPPDAAARPFLQGRAAVLDGRYREGVASLEEALRTGHTSPQEHFGTSRHPVDYYDPHYWLGRAYMELGDEARAAEHLRISRDAGVITRRPEYSDLSSRLADLGRRRETRVAVVATPEPTRTAPHEAPPLEAVPTPAQAPPLAPAPLSPDTPDRSGPGTGAPATTSTPRPLPVGRGDLRRALTLLSVGDFPGAEEALRRFRRNAPDAPEADLLEAVTAANRYVLGGGRDRDLLTLARQRLASFRKKGGASRAEGTWLSPALRTVLAGR